MFLDHRRKAEKNPQRHRRRGAACRKVQADLEACYKEATLTMATDQQDQQNKDEKPCMMKKKKKKKGHDSALL